MNHDSSLILPSVHFEKAFLWCLHVAGTITRRVDVFQHCCSFCDGNWELDLCTMLRYFKGVFPLSAISNLLPTNILYFLLHYMHLISLLQAVLTCRLFAAIWLFGYFCITEEHVFKYVHSSSGGIWHSLTFEGKTYVRTLVSSISDICKEWTSWVLQGLR